MRRRQHHLRSKNGCNTCKTRHVRCDERLPYCGNCLRVGRECIYSGNTSGDSSDSGPESPPVAEASIMSLNSATQQAWVARNLPQAHAVNFMPPHYHDLDHSTIAILQHAHEILGQRPMPRCCLLPIQKDHAPRYNQLAARHKCVKFSHISFAAYTHYQETKESRSREIYIQYTCDALNELQKEIRELSDDNVDAVIAASIGLARTTDNWDQCVVFIDGYTRALSYIRENAVESVCPELLGGNFQTRSFFTEGNGPVSTQPVTKSDMHHRVRSLVDFITALKDTIGNHAFHSTGFFDLERLAGIVETAIGLESDSEIYHQLASLRSWMFLIELRRPAENNEQQALICYSYALMLAVVSLFPERYWDSLTRTCRDRMWTILHGMDEESSRIYGLPELMDSVHGTSADS